MSTFRMRSRALFVGALIVLTAALWPLAAGPAEAAPPNDNLASATIVGPLPYTNTVDTTGATSELGEPKPACQVAGFPTTVWYDFTGTGSAVQVDTFGSTFNTVLAVYTGPAVGSLTAIPGACSDNTTASASSQVVFNTTLGTIYHIQAAGVPGTAGSLRLNVHTPNFIVNSPADTNDGNCNSNVAIAVDCTLREAIIASNTFPNPANQISFNIGGGGAHVISPGSALPSVTSRVSIDGRTQPGYGGSPLIEVQGSGAGPGVNGIAIATFGAAVRGLSINRFGFAGIHLNPFADTVTIEANRIGTNAASAPGIGNGTGIAVFGKGAMIGGNTAAQRNIISGNLNSGVLLTSPTAEFNSITGNYIGTDAAGTAPLPNENGIRISAGATLNQVGWDYTLGYGNVISGNIRQGVVIDGVATDSNMLAGNAIGTDPSGSSAIPNMTGVEVSGTASSNDVGMGGPTLGNLISGNFGDGVFIHDSGTNGNRLQGNGIGVNLSGTSAIPNGSRGVAVVAGASGTIIGGATSSARNYISGNGAQGIHVSGATDTHIKGNYIGLNAAGTALIGATGNGGPCGVLVDAGTGTLVGNAVPGEGNTISGSPTANVCVYGPASLGAVAGNNIGTDAAGTTALSNPGSGVLIAAAPSSSWNVGYNVIGGNAANGIYVNNSSGVDINANRIGTDSSQTQILTNGTGVRLDAGSSNNSVFSNVISNSSGDGIVMLDPGTTGNLLDANEVYDNSALGIDLGGDGVTANDALDADAGPNGVQNYPVVAYAYESGGTTTIGVSLHSRPNDIYIVQVFDSVTCDPSSFGEGADYLNGGLILTDSAGNGTQTFNVFSAIPAGHAITAVAINIGTEVDNSSEFSECEAVVSCIGEIDCDGIPDAIDNCQAIPNPAQTNGDSGPPPPAGQTGFLSNGPGIPGEDLTIPSGDKFGDVCDGDLDNDLRADADELAGVGCGGVVTQVDADFGYSDGDPTTWDTDGDVVADGVECALGTNPTVPSGADRTACNASQPDGDDDGDGLQNDWEKCKWLTSVNSAHSDPDAIGDCREVMDVNGNGAVTNADAVFVKQHVFFLIVGDLASMDINANAVITNGDAVFIQQAVFAVNPCL